MNKPELVNIRDLLILPKESTEIWIDEKLKTIVSNNFNFTITTFPEIPSNNVENIIVIGGGTLIDYAKIWKYNNNPSSKLFVIPSIWGSGAENSPIAILNDEKKKNVYIGSQYLPDYRIIWPDLLKTLNIALIKAACGDVWAHALEGFLSPLADEQTRICLGELIQNLLKLEIGNNLQWFDMSAQAVALQAKSSSGLVHGIAHEIEIPIKELYQDKLFGHAKLCSLLLWPVFKYNLQKGEQIIQHKLSIAGLNCKDIEEKLKELYEEDLFNLLLPFIEKYWQIIIRNPITRLNCVLVRPSSLNYFINRDYNE